MDDGWAMKRIATNSTHYGSRRWEGSALGGEAAPRIRLAPGQIEVLPSPGALSCSSEAGVGRRKVARFHYLKTMIPIIAKRKSGKPRFWVVWLLSFCCSMDVTR